ncbi:MAG TPA: citrate/2-methylcitrate synthase, partial [Pyrinomonadaceae bacterium]|nr:citrate/2-methylcitrate synthase [Pyrinomonadaceae bacterium]
METGKDSTAATPAANAGLRGVVAAQSKIGDVNGEQGILIYQGYDIHDLAANSNFEEVVYLLWNERLPNQAELDALCAEFRAHYAIPAEIVEMMKAFPKDAEPMDVLRTTVSALAFFDKESAHKTDRDSAVKASIKLTAQFPALVAAWERIRQGKDVVAPLPDQSIAYNFMYQLKGETPDAEEVHMMDICLILHADHEQNASTSTVRLAGS